MINSGSLICGPKMIQYGAEYARCRGESWPNWGFVLCVLNNNMK